MKPIVEALVLPSLFLTVTLLGGLRPGAGSPLAPPSPLSLVGAVILLALLVQSGTLASLRLVNGARSLVANANGVSLLVCLFLASAQVLTLLVPESGVPALIGCVVLGSLLAQALAIAPDRRRLLRGLLVTLGAAFVLKFVLLAALSSPAEGRVARALQILFEGVTLGAVAQRPPHALEAYLAFATLVLYIFGVAWLPPAEWQMVRVERVVDRLDMARPTSPIAARDNE